MEPACSSGPEPYPLGATYDGAGTNFALFCEVAERVELCLFDGTARDPRRAARERRVRLARVPAAASSRASATATACTAPTTRRTGHRCNPSKLLLDPYAKAVEGDDRLGAGVLLATTSTTPTEQQRRDCAPHVMKSVVINPFFDWDDDRAPAHRLPRDGHLRGARQGPDRAAPGHPRGDPRHLRRRSRHPAMIEHLTQLGVTAIELMPVHQFVHDCHLVEQGPRNYWGYNTIGFFAPHNAYAASGDAGQQVLEFKAMVSALHRAGIEVILDVVYNHTAEGNHLGPDAVASAASTTPSYYRLVDDDQAHYYDTTGTGNTPAHAQPARAAADHGLAALLGHRDARRRLPLRPRGDASPAQFHEVDRLSRVLRPRPAGPGRLAGQADRRAVGRRPRRLPGRQLPAAAGPSGTASTATPCATTGAASRATLGEFASRLTGSTDLYEDDGRRPFASINFVTAHDGFTLRDLVSYNDKHNEANGEDNNGRREPQPLLELRRRGPDRRPRDPRAAGAAAAQLPGDAAAVPGRADAAPRRRARPHPARQQQRLLPGQRALLGRLGARVDDATCSSSPRSSPSCAREHPVFRRRRFFTRPSVAATSAAGHRLVRRRRRARWTTRTGTTASARPLAVFLNGDGITESGPARRARSSTTRSCCCSTRTSRALEFIVLPRNGASAGSSSSTRPRIADRKSADQRRVTAGKSMSVEGTFSGAVAPHWSEPCRSPTATYRLQLQARLRLRRRRVARAVPGRPRRVARSICSPVLQAGAGLDARLRRPGPLGARDELGGAAGLDRMVQAAARPRARASSSTSCPTTWPCPCRRPATRPCGRC